MSPISSKNSVPPLACSKRPSRFCAAPVNAPFSCPKSSDSIRSLGIAAMLRAIKGLLARGEWRCRALATSSLPVPDSPLINTVILLCASRPMARNTSCMAGASPMISVVGEASSSSSVVFCCSRRWVIARSVMAITSSISKGLGKYSKAPC